MCEFSVQSINSPFSFYVHLINATYDHFLEFEEALQAYYEQVYLHQSEFIMLKRPQLGQECVARFADDERWYRARITELGNGVVRVFFVDYGNQALVSVNGGLVVLRDEFAHFPHIAVRCCLDGIRPTTVEEINETGIAKSAADFMFDELEERVRGEFVRKSASNDCYMVTVRVAETTLAQMLIERKYVLAAPGGKTVKSPPHAPPARPAAAAQQTVTVAAAAVSASIKPRLIPIRNDCDLRPSNERRVYTNGEIKLKFRETYEIYVINVETINEFYVQLAGK